MIKYWTCTEFYKSMFVDILSMEMMRQYERIHTHLECIFLIGQRLRWSITPFFGNSLFLILGSFIIFLTVATNSVWSAQECLLSIFMTHIFDREPCKFSFTCEFCQVIVIFIYSCDNIDHFKYFWAPKFLLTFSVHFEDSYFKFINLSSIKLLNLANSKWIKTFFPSPNVIVHIFDVAVRCKTNAPDIDRYSVWIIRDQVHEAYEFGSQMSIIIFNRNGF